MNAAVMKPISLALTLSVALAATCFAGTTTYSSGKEMKQAVVPTCEEFYGDHEFNVSVWGTYAFTGTESDRTKIEIADDLGIFGDYDKFLGGDHAWGGGIDAKYFFCRYFGVGFEGFGLAGRGSHAAFDEGPNPEVSEEMYQKHDHAVGGAFGTATFRFPISRCSRWAPYAFAGFGGVFGGANDQLSRFSGGEGGPFTESNLKDESRVAGVFGGGMEYRITRHIGIMGDFSWVVVDGSHNNFGMVRSGVNFAF